MINLRLDIKGDFSDVEPFVIQLEEAGQQNQEAPHSANFTRNGKEVSISTTRGSFKCFLNPSEKIQDDICIVFPQKNILLRLIRTVSTTNTILLTEQCDQACVMCSQPPKNKIYDHYELYYEALMLSAPDIVIGISGGEPTLEKANLLSFIERVLSDRPDLKFHILTNGQHFVREDIPALKRLNHAILWGVPLYSHLPSIHDEVVGKVGAYEYLLRGLNILFQSGASVELRTVLLQQNYKDLPLLADFICRHLSVCHTWAIMQLENIGFAKMNWAHLFVDTSRYFSAVSTALDISAANNVNASLYNFPLCTVPDRWQQYACKSISDWKNKYIDVCSDCSLRSKCGGFFDWYDEKTGFKEVGLR